jgi:hypothetical protein
MKRFLSALTAILLSLGLATFAFAQNSPIREITLKPELSHAGTIKYTTPYFVLIHRNGNPGDGQRFVSVLDTNGQELFFRNLLDDVPDASYVGIHDAAANANGHLVICGTAVSSREQLASVLLIYDVRANRLERIVRTSPIAPLRAAIDEQNNIWVLGLTSRGPQTATQDEPLIHKYSLTGQSLGDYVSSDMFSISGNRQQLLWQGGTDHPQVYSNQKGGVFVLLPKVTTMLELNLNGEIGSRTKINPDGLDERWGPTLGIQPNGTLLSIRPLKVKAGQGGYAINRLAPSANNWVALRSTSTSLASMQNLHNPQQHFMAWRGIVGADESNLILRDYESGKIFWLPLP